MAALYYLGSALFLLPFSIKELRREFFIIKNNRNDLFKLLGATIFGGILGPITLFMGLKISNASSAALLLNFEGVWTFFLGWAFFKEHINKKIIIAMLATIIGDSLLVIEKDINFNLGGILIILACLFWGLDNNLSATIEGVSATTNTILKSFFAALFNLIIFFFFIQSDSNNNSNIEQFFQINFLYILLVGGLSYGLSIVLYIKSSKFLGAIRSQMIFSLNPFWGALLSFALFTEELNFNFVLATIFMSLALLLLFFEKHHHEHYHADEEHEHLHSHDDSHHRHEHTNDLQKKITEKTHHIHRHHHLAINHDHGHFPDLHHRHKHK